MTDQGVVTPASPALPLWQTAGSELVFQDVLASFEEGELRGVVRDALLLKPELASQAALQKIQRAPFRDRLKLRRQRYVPLQPRSPWQTLSPLFLTEQWELRAAGKWQGPQPDILPPHSEHYWAMARLQSLAPVPASQAWTGDLAPGEAHRLGIGQPEVDQQPGIHSQTGFISWEPYLYVGISEGGDLSLRLLPVSLQTGLRVVCSTLDGVGREFKIAAQASFIQRITQLQEIQLELRQEFAIRQSLYNALAQTPIQSAQAVRYFDRLLDETPYPASKTPASDRLLLRRQLLKNFAAVMTKPSLWDAYAAVTQWVNYGAPGSPTQRWWSCCHGPGAQMLRQALAYAVALQYDQQDPFADSTMLRPSGAQRSLAASDALQTRIQQLRNGEVMASQLSNP